MRKPVELLLLNDVDEIPCRLELERILHDLSEKNRLQLWHRGKIGAHANEEEQFQQALDRADVVVLLLSPALLTKHPKELKAILALHASKDLEIIGLPIRALDPGSFKGLSKLPVFPGWRFPLYVGKEMDKQTLYSMSQHLRQIILHVYGQPEYLTFMDLQDRLKLFLRQRGFLRFYQLMEQLLEVSPALHGLKKLHHQYLDGHRFSQVKKQPTFPYLLYQQLYQILEDWILQLEKRDLIPNWVDAFPALCLQMEESVPVPATAICPVFVPEKALQIPPGLSPQEVAVCQKQYDSFRMALFTDRYDPAWKIAQQLWDEAPITHKSWYEYLLLGLWAAKGAHQIVRESLQGDNTFKLLSYYDQALQELEDQADLRAYNHALMGTELASALIHQYQNMPSQGGPTKERLEMLFHLQMDIHRQFESATGFMEYAVHELLGMGYEKWIRPVKAVKAGWLLEDLQVYGAVNELENLFQEMVLDFNQISAIPHTCKVWDNLLSKLRLNYEYLCLKALETGEDQESFRADMVSLLQTAQTAYTISKDGRFLDILIEELSHRGALPWLAFDENGQMTHYPGIDYDALTQLRHALQLRHHQADAKIEALKKELYALALHQLKQQSSDLKRSIEGQMAFIANIRLKQAGLINTWKHNRGIEPNEESIHNLSKALDANRLALFDCIEKWYHLYLVSQNEYCLEELLKELNGSGLMLWFDLAKLQLHPYGPCQRLGIPVQELLEKVMALKPDWRPSFEKQVAHHLYRVEVVPIYEKIEYRNEAQRYLIPRIIRRCMACYAFTGHEKYYNLIYRELVEEHKFGWLDIDLQEKGLGNGTYDDNLGFDALWHLRQLLKMSGKNAQEEEYKILSFILNKRHSELLKRYMRDINVFPANNNQHDREMVAQMIHICLTYHDILPSEKWLYIPINELLEKGKIHWTKVSGKKGEHPENQLLAEPINYRAARMQVQALAAQYPGSIQRREGFRVLGLRL